MVKIAEAAARVFTRTISMLPLLSCSVALNQSVVLATGNKSALAASTVRLVSVLRMLACSSERAALVNS